jgi:zinc transport system ATP-binding protein
MTMQKLIKLDNLSLSFSNVNVLSGINLEINSGEIVTIIGPNGAGKSTLIKAVLGLITQYTGQIWRKPNLTVGYMPQNIKIESLMPLTVGGFLSVAKKSSSLDLTSLLKLLSIEKIITTPIQNISGGEMQRLLLARALLNKPELLVLDEPTQGIDVNGQVELYRLIKEIRDQYNCGILLVSHDLHLVMSGTDQVICLNQHICCQGSPQDVSRNPEFLHLFGSGAVEDLAVYAHTHDHHHNIAGKIVDDN